MKQESNSLTYENFRHINKEGIFVRLYPERLRGLKYLCRNQRITPTGRTYWTVRRLKYIMGIKRIKSIENLIS